MIEDNPTTANTSWATTTSQSESWYEAGILLNLDGYPSGNFTSDFVDHQLYCAFGEFVDFQNADHVRYRINGFSGMSGGGVMAFHEGHASNATGPSIIHFVHAKVDPVGNIRHGVRFTEPKQVDAKGCVCLTPSEIAEFVECV